MGYIFILLSILYSAYYFMYKYIIEIGTSVIYWTIWNTALFVAIAYIFPVSKFIFSIMVGNSIIVLMLLLWVVVTRDDVLELIKQRLDEYK